MSKEIKRDEISILLRFKSFMFSLKYWIGPKTVIIVLCAMLSFLYASGVLDAEMFRVAFGFFFK
jgi:hypothetical protein